MAPRGHPRPTILWFRNDLRLADNPALRAACDRGAPILPVYIHSPGEEDGWQLGAASGWWLHRSLGRLDASLRERGSRLLIRRGEALATLRQLVVETGADAVFWNRRYEPAAIKRDVQVKKEMQDRGIRVETYSASLLHEPWSVQKKVGGPFQVFTPFYRACLGIPEPARPTEPPHRLSAPARWPRAQQVADLALEPSIDWADGLRATWEPGEEGALRLLRHFIDANLGEYPIARDRPDLSGTSRLSPHLRFGEIAPNRIWHAIAEHAARQTAPGAYAGAEAFLRQMIWREFAYHLLYHFPTTPMRPLREEFASFRWRRGGRDLRLWQRGQTGYPIVDAGMRQLWRTGWMHNRARMIVASFLVKDLLISWIEGARWFWDTLVDADLANNTLGWQWTAGCGADAAPYFRVFHPVLQGLKFDPRGDYVRRWVPELSRLPAQWIHQPWKAPDGVLDEAGVTLGTTYPRPIVERAAARERALSAFAASRRRRGQ